MERTKVRKDVDNMGTPKRRPGRPGSGRDPAITVRLSRETIEMVNMLRVRYGFRSRSSAVRALVETAHVAAIVIRHTRTKAAI